MDLSMPKFHDLLIGTHLINETVEYMGPDDENLYSQNLNTQPQDWYYRNNKVIYSHNEFGHRCNSLNSLNFNNYFLFSGCSHTYGVGVELEKTYAYLLSNACNTYYYNLSFGGAGPDFAFYNLLIWLDKFPKPKHIFVQIPYSTRFMTQRNTDGSYNSDVTFESHWSNQPEVKKFAVIGKEINYWSCKMFLYFNLFKQRCLKYNIPYTIINFIDPVDLLEIPEKMYEVKRVDLARDLGHFGNQTNINIAKDLQQLIS